MKSPSVTTRLALYATRLVAVLVVAVGIFLSKIIDWYEGFRMMTDMDRTVVSVCYYLAAIAILYALFSMDRLLTAILAGLVFVRKNVRRIRRIQWCCAAVAVITAVAAFAYMPLIFAAAIMCFLTLTVCVVTRVMDAAVTIREENDLTV